MTVIRKEEQIECEQTLRAVQAGKRQLKIELTACNEQLAACEEELTARNEQLAAREEELTECQQVKIELEGANNSLAESAEQMRELQRELEELESAAMAHAAEIQVPPALPTGGCRRCYRGQRGSFAHCG